MSYYRGKKISRVAINRNGKSFFIYAGGNRYEHKFDKRKGWAGNRQLNSASIRYWKEQKEERKERARKKYRRGRSSGFNPYVNPFVGFGQRFY